MTDAEMAAALRAKGWVCREPVEAGAPKPEFGQLWQTMSGSSRMVIGTNDGAATLDYVSSFGGTATVPVDTFLAWARKTGARPL